MAPMTNGSLLSGAGPDVPHLTILGDNRRMRSPIPIAAGLALLLTAVHAMAQERILISSEWGNVSADLADNAATRSLVEMLPLTIEMRDHLRQEKTGNLPSPLPEVARQRDFSAGTLGLWGPDDFVLYYVGGQVPAPGIIILGKVTGDVSIFDRPGPITIRVERGG